MRFIFASMPSFEPWDWTNPDTVGIGGSETSAIEMSQRLARRGHEVVHYSPTPYVEERVDPAGVRYLPSAHAVMDWEADTDIWIVYRDPEVADHLPPGTQAWLICQDIDYRLPGHELTPERAQKFARIVALCGPHAQYLKWAHPEVRERVCISSNGIKAETIQEILKSPPPRNPHRLMYASSPDRGMEYLLKLFPRILELVPDAELHVYYGFDNVEKVEKFMPRVKVNNARLKALLDQPGVVHHGRTPQAELLREWFQAGVWCHTSNFRETSCITCMDAQACGAVPVTQPVWAIAENVQHGIFIHGSLEMELVRARYVLETFKLLMDPERQATIRAAMMPWALERFNWERFVDQWEDWAAADVESAPVRPPTPREQLAALGLAETGEGSRIGDSRAALAETDEAGLHFDPREAVA